MAGLRDRRGRRHPRELGPRRPREDLHHRQEGRGGRGPNGVDGIIGWYVPPWMVDKYPDITDWNNLNKYADLFKTSESGDKGQFLGGDPTFVKYDEALITNLDLNYKVVFSGSEAALINAFQQADQNKTAADRLLLRPAVAPERDQARPGQPAAVHGGCDADATKKVACDYPPYKPEQDRQHEPRDQGADGRPRSSRTSSGPTPTRTRSPTPSRTTRCRARTPPRSGSTPTRTSGRRGSPPPDPVVGTMAARPMARRHRHVPARFGPPAEAVPWPRPRASSSSEPASSAARSPTSWSCAAGPT